MDINPGVLKQLQLKEFRPAEDEIRIGNNRIKRYTGEFWTSRQRKGNSIHEISYRACYKAELPGFFIKRMATRHSMLFDPFSGRGTTIIEGALNGIAGISMDVNPLSEVLTYPRIYIPEAGQVEKRLESIFRVVGKYSPEMELSMFFHKETEKEILHLREYLEERKENGSEDEVDRWIRMVATNRLTGHSKGFFSVYTLPPNQAVSPRRQSEINTRLGIRPEYRNTREIILKKSMSLLRHITPEIRENLKRARARTRVITADSREIHSAVEEGSVDLTVTSPPFLNVVQYSSDNWLRCWFNHIELGSVEKNVFVSGSISEWSGFVSRVLRQIYRVTSNGGRVAFEVGEVRDRKEIVFLDELVAGIAIECGFDVPAIMVNEQVFTKTSNIWGVKNSQKGTNTNRIVLMEKHE